MHAYKVHRVTAAPTDVALGSGGLGLPFLRGTVSRDMGPGLLPGR